MSAFRRAGPTVLLVAAVVLSGGCTVSVDRTDRDSALAEQWRRTQRVQLDLTTPLDRERAGFPPGASSLPLERRPPEVLDVALTLPGGTRLDVPAISMTIAATYTDQPDRIAIARLADQDEGLSVLADAVERFGLDRELHEAFLDSVASGSGEVNRSVGEVQLGYLHLGVEARFDGAEHTLQVNYLLTWDEPAGSPA